MMSLIFLFSISFPCLSHRAALLHLLPFLLSLLLMCLILINSWKMDLEVSAALTMKSVANYQCFKRPQMPKTQVHNLCETIWIIICHWHFISFALTPRTNGELSIVAVVEKCVRVDAESSTGGAARLEERPGARHGPRRLLPDQPAYHHHTGKTTTYIHKPTQGTSSQDGGLCITTCLVQALCFCLWL